ncbi:MAG TPA: hypothetical protein PKK54_01535 [bacterium]|nr:hypothetical protein [bacterium]
MKKIKSIIDEGGGIKTTDPREAQQSKEQSIINSFNKEAVFFKRIIEDIESVEVSKNASLYRENVANIGRRDVNVLEIIRMATFPNSPNSQGMSDVINMGGILEGAFKANPVDRVIYYDEENPRSRTVTLEDTEGSHIGVTIETIYDPGRGGYTQKHPYPSEVHIVIYKANKREPLADLTVYYTPKATEVKGEIKGQNASVNKNRFENP